jgi:hypothetical protein
MRARAYSDADAARWDDLVGRSACGTFLHTRRFLSYHGARFTDASVVVEDGNGRLIGVLPAALKPGDAGWVISHPGATYGGLLHGHRGSAGEVEAMLAAILDHYRRRRLDCLEYRSVPPHLQSPFSQADLHALRELGAATVARELWSVVSLHDRPGCSKGHQSAIARARRNGIVAGVADGDAAYREFHSMLEACLAERHAASPVHTLAEMRVLRDGFPRNIALWLARDGDSGLLAGCWVFTFGHRAWHTQYIASTPQGRAASAAHLLLDEVMRAAVERGVAFFSLGASSSLDDAQVNSGVLRFKAGFGSGALCRDICRVGLQA